MTSNKQPWMVDSNYYTYFTSEEAESQSFAQSHTVKLELEPTSWLNLVLSP